MKFGEWFSDPVREVPYYDDRPLTDVKRLQREIRRWKLACCILWIGLVVANLHILKLLWRL